MKKAINNRNNYSKSIVSALRCAKERSLFGPDNCVLLMVSGGSDSTALARIAAELRAAGEVGALAMLHVNHKLRGEDAEEDARFVQALATELDIPLFICEIDIASEAKRTGENVEAVARRERYLAANEALASMCEHEGYAIEDGRVATAHTLDDRIENFYMRSIVGTGPGGFRSMLYRNGNIVRPLLDMTREDLRDYLRERAKGTEYFAHFDQNVQNIPSPLHELWREDATNAHTDRFRAYVRAEIVPRAKEWDAQMPTTLARSMNLIADEDDMLDEIAREIIEQKVKLDDAKSSFKLLPNFGEERRPLQRRVLIKLMKEMLGQEERIDTATVEAILEAFDNETGRPKSGYVTNIQGNLAVSSNKTGVLVEPMAAYRKRRKGK